MPNISEEEIFLEAENSNSSLSTAEDCCHRLNEILESAQSWKERLEKIRNRTDGTSCKKQKYEINKQKHNEKI